MLVLLLLGPLVCRDTAMLPPPELESRRERPAFERLFAGFWEIQKIMGSYQDLNQDKSKSQI
jgi:hypothetical protein